MKEISEALKKRIADRAEAPVPVAVIGLPIEDKKPSPIVGLPSKVPK